MRDNKARICHTFGGSTVVNMSTILDEQELSAFQDFLLAAYAQQVSKSRRRKLSDTQFAQWLGVNPAAYNTWINGTRKPDLASAIKLSEKLGPGVFETLGYPRLYKIDDPELSFIIDNWEALDHETQARVLAAIKGE